MSLDRTAWNADGGVAGGARAAHRLVWGSRFHSWSIHTLSTINSVYHLFIFVSSFRLLLSIHSAYCQLIYLVLVFIYSSFRVKK